jgi:hypothetical protein
MIICGIVGWTKQIRLTAAVCVLASLWAASNAYLDAAGRELLAKEQGRWSMPMPTGGFRTRRRSGQPA